MSVHEYQLVAVKKPWVPEWAWSIVKHWTALAWLLTDPRPCSRPGCLRDARWVVVDDYGWIHKGDVVCDDDFPPPPPPPPYWQGKITPPPPPDPLNAAANEGRNAVPDATDDQAALIEALLERVVTARHPFTCASCSGEWPDAAGYQAHFPCPA